MKKKIWFKLFTDCIIVKGYTESLIYDLGRGTHYPIPNEFIPILEELQNSSLTEFKKNNNCNDIEITNFINQFIKEELAFFTYDPLSFPKLSLNWETPFLITNAILEIGKKKGYNIFNTITQLNEIGCKAVQININYNIDYCSLTEYLIFFNETRINCVDILIPFNDNLVEDSLFELINDFPRIRRIIIYKANKNLVVINDDILFNERVIYTKKDIQKKPTEVIKKENLRFNLKSFCESQNHNLGLNRKVCITNEGNIKNFLTINEEFGNVNFEKISDVVKKKEFQKKWRIPNDQIEKCKDCQYRYSCSSNSDIKIENKLYYKKNLCSFNPYTNEWKPNDLCSS